MAEVSPLYQEIDRLQEELRNLKGEILSAVRNLERALAMGKWESVANIFDYLRKIASE
jgi:hypothetical protein